MKFKNEVVVGIVVVLALAVMVIGGFWLSGKPFGETQKELTAVFQQVGLLRPGNPVVYRGVNVGRVTDVDLAPQGNGVLVGMEIDPDVNVARDAVVVLAPQSFFGDWQAEITVRAAYPALEFTTIRAPGVLPGATLPDITQLTAVAARIAGDIETLSQRFEVAFTEETAIKLRQTIENVQETTAQLSGFVEKQTQTFDNVSGEVLTATRNIRSATATVERLAGEVESTFTEGEIQQILANARQASENLEELSTQLQSATQGVPALVARTDTTLQTVSNVAVRVDTLLQGLQPQIQEIGPTIAEARTALATLQRASARIEQGEGTLGRLLEDPALYEETQAAIATLRRVMADLQANPNKYLRGVIDVF